MQPTELHYYHIEIRDWFVLTGSFAYDYNKTPGPAAYPVSDQNKVKPSAPEVSLKPLMIVTRYFFALVSSS